MPLLTVLLALGPAKAATIEVNPDACLAPGIACSIEEAIDNAVSGDTIRWVPVADGDTTPAIQESVVIDGSRFAALTIESVAGAAATVWQPPGEDGTQIIVQNGAELTLAGFRFELGTDSCVRADNSDLIIMDAEFVLCHRDTNGGAVFATDGDIEILDTLFYANTSDGHGGAVFFGGPVDGANSLNVERAMFEDNESFDPLSVGGAIATRFVESVNVIDSNFLGNTSFARGGGLSVEFGDELVVEGSTFQLNSSFYFLAADEFDDSDEGETVGLVYSTGQGGAVYFDGESMDMSRSLFCGNLADDGGGVYSVDIASNEYRNNVFADNWATHYGGGLNSSVTDGAEASEPVIVNNTFVGNSAGLFPDPQVIVVFGAGGSIALDGSLADIRNNIISATYFGGGIFGNDGDLFTIGDPIAIEYNLLYENCDFINCEESQSQHYTSDLDAYAVSTTNLRANPQLVYYRGESDCYPDAFYPDVGSPVIDTGDPSVLDAIGGQSDIGAYGGPGADIKDEDGDGWANIYDCNDLSPAINPTQADVCDQIDNNCDGEIDEEYETEWYPDNDRDGYGDSEALLPIFECLDLSPAYVNNNDDCDDEDDNRAPGNLETCDGVDNDCNITIDDPDKLVFDAWVPDADGDGFGDSSISGIVACAAPDPSYVNVGGDCDDGNAAINPDAAEVCDGLIDNDCDGQEDEDPTELTATWYLDEDQDGVGAGDPVLDCNMPTDGGTYVNETGDCDDSDASSYPAVTRVADSVAVAGGLDVCDGRDNDCSGVADDDQSQQTAWYLDGDADGFGDDKTVLWSCDEPGANYVVKGGDCDDENVDVGECAECGCQSAPGGGHAGFLGLLGAMLVLRRRRS
ncbi:MAG: MYXO-CTERM domain-containing protein [Myxococcota bacterium]|jgi:MYXO-CTERM domain-containing protein